MNWSYLECNLTWAKWIHFMQSHSNWIKTINFIRNSLSFAQFSFKIILLCFEVFVRGDSLIPLIQGPFKYSYEPLCARPFKWPVIVRLWFTRSSITSRRFEWNLNEIEWIWMKFEWNWMNLSDIAWNWMKCWVESGGIEWNRMMLNDFLSEI